MGQEGVDEILGRRAARAGVWWGKQNALRAPGVCGGGGGVGGWQASPPYLHVSAFPEPLKNRHAFYIKGKS